MPEYVRVNMLYSRVEVANSRLLATAFATILLIAIKLSCLPSL